MFNNKLQGNCDYQLFTSFGLTRRKNQTQSTNCEADALTTRPRAGTAADAYDNNAQDLDVSRRNFSSNMP